MKNTRLWIVALSVVLAGITLAADAQSIVTNIAWAKRETTNPYFADELGSNTDYTVIGRVTSPNFDTNNTEMFIQDTNDNVGIQVLIDFQPNAGLQVGVLASARGVIGQTNGLRYIKPTLSSRFSVVDPTILPVAPLYSQVSNFVAQGEAYESSLVVVSNATFAFTNWPAWGAASASNRITDGTGEMPMYIVSDTLIGGQLIPTNAFTVRGIVTQFDRNTNTPNGGYQIQPRSYADIIQTTAEQPPQIYVRNSNAVFSVGVNSEIGIDVLGQDRNGEDALALSLVTGPSGAALTDYGNRAGRFTWTPDISFVGTTNAATIEVTDGDTTNSVTLQVTVRATSGGTGYAWINEFHYENAGTDVGEGIELAGQAGLDLTNYYVILYNLSGALYGSNAFGGLIDDEGNGYGAIWKAYPTDGLRNTQGGIALYHVTNGLLQFISYGGAFTATNGPAAGQSSIDVGVVESSVTPVDQSLQLQGNGTNYEAFTWTGPMTQTRGDLNGSGQIIIGPVNAKVAITNLALNPIKPAPGSAFDIDCLITPNYSASNLVATAWYRINAGIWNSIGMTDLGGYTNRTSSQIPAQTNGTPIEYYVSVVFDGPNAVSPVVSVTNSATILAYPPTILPLTNRVIQVSNTLSMVVYSTEPDGDMITLTASNLPANANFYPTNGVSAASGSFEFTPDAGQVGVYTTLFCAVDKEGAVFSNFVITVNPAGYFVNFEGVGETKTAYAPANVTLSGISWNMDDALIGTSPADRKNGLRSARCRTNSVNMAMLADKNGGCGTISLLYAKYGTDVATSTGRVEYSTNGGGSWTQAGTEFVALSTNLALFTATVNQAGGVRMRIIRTCVGTSSRMNIDDILMTDYSGGGSGDVDGIPVSWWDRYNIPTGERVATNNPDGDVDNNFEEFVADTDPTNNTSYFVYKITNMTGIGTMQLLVGPPTTNSRVYDAFWCTNLVVQGWTPLNFNVPGMADGSSFYLTVTNDAAGRFYRTGVKVP